MLWNDEDDFKEIDATRKQEEEEKEEIHSEPECIVYQGLCELFETDLDKEDPYYLAKIVDLTMVMRPYRGKEYDDNKKALHSYLWDGKEIIRKGSVSGYLSNIFPFTTSAEIVAGFTGRDSHELQLEWDARANIGTVFHSLAESFLNLVRETPIKGFPQTEVYDRHQWAKMIAERFFDKPAPHFILEEAYHHFHRGFLEKFYVDSNTNGNKFTSDLLRCEQCFYMNQYTGTVDLLGYAELTVDLKKRKIVAADEQGENCVRICGPLLIDLKTSKKTVAELLRKRDDSEVVFRYRTKKNPLAYAYGLNEAHDELDDSDGEPKYVHRTVYNTVMQKYWMQTSIYATMVDKCFGVNPTCAVLVFHKTAGGDVKYDFILLYNSHKKAMQLKFLADTQKGEL